ncbi:MAG: hypothetical protein ACI4AM_02745 [Muribaculaceae bacterium]
MSYNVKSKEFADAWRIVSEALLAMIQQGNVSLPSQLLTGSNSGSTTTDNPAVVDTASDHIPDTDVEVVSYRTAVETLYSAVPLKNEDGTYSFKRMRSDRDNHFYRIFVYDDDSCEFELCTELSSDKESENLQNLRDSVSNSMPEGVCQVVAGKLNSDVKSIRIACRGKCHKTGRFSCVIDTPCKVVIQ